MIKDKRHMISVLHHQIKNSILKYKSVNSNQIKSILYSFDNYTENIQSRYNDKT